MTDPNRPADPGEDAPTVAYTPPPADRRPDWAAPAWTDAPAAVPTEPVNRGSSAEGPPSLGWSPGAASPSSEATPAWPGSDAGASNPPPPPPATNGHSNGQKRTGPGAILAASVLSAILASGGTVLALKGTGALDPATTTGANGSPAVTTGSRQPITIDESSAIIDAAAKAGPAVVRILVAGTVTDPLGGTIPERGIGSGIIFDADGWVLTNKHVVTAESDQIADSITVELKDGRTFEGEVYGVDTLTDLAIVKFEAPDDLTAATIGSSADLEVGQLAIAIGSPLGTYSNSVTSGIVSATGRSVTVESGDRLNNLIQTDAAINQGNSGGPLLDATGSVIGINTAVAQEGTGIGFAIPIDLARPLMQQALAGEELSRPYIGVRYIAVDRDVQDEESLSVDHGALVADAQNAAGETLPGVIPDGPADDAGVELGDVIVAIDGQTIDTEHPLDLILSSFAPDQEITLEVIRDGQTLELTVTLGVRPPDL